VGRVIPITARCGMQRHPRGRNGLGTVFKGGIVKVRFTPLLQKFGLDEAPHGQERAARVFISGLSSGLMIVPGTNLLERSSH
jgi:hypothetical protein